MFDFKYIYICIAYVDSDQTPLFATFDLGLQCCPCLSKESEALMS